MAILAFRQAFSRVRSDRAKCGLCFVALFIINLMAALESTGISTAIPKVAEDLNASVTEIYWAGTSFALCSALSQPIFAAIASLGRKICTFIAISLFLLGSILCAIAQSVPIFLLGRSFQGIGSGGITLSTFVLLADFFEYKARIQLVGIIGLVSLFGTACGPLLGGTLTTKATWRWIFYLNMPLCGISYAAVAILIKPTSMTGAFIHHLQRVDWIGLLLLSPASVSLLLGLSWGGVVFAWPNWQTTLPIYLGFLGLMLFGMYSYFLSKNPMIPPSIMVNRNVATGHTAIFLHAIIQFAVLYYSPVYYQFVKELTPITAGAALVPVAVVAGLAGAFTNYLIARSHLLKAFSIVGFLFLLVGLAQLTLLNSGSSTLAWFMMLLPVSTGLGICQTCLSLTAQQCEYDREHHSPEDHMRTQSRAVGLTPFVRSYGQAFGVTIGQAILANQMKHNMPSLLIGDLVIVLQKSATADEGQRQVLVAALTGSLRALWWTLVAIAGVGLMLMLCTKGTNSKPNPTSNDTEKVVCEEQKPDDALECQPSTFVDNAAEPCDGTTLLASPATPARPVAPASPTRSLPPSPLRRLVSIVSSHTKAASEDGRESPNSTTIPPNQSRFIMPASPKKSLSSSPLRRFTSIVPQKPRNVSMQTV